MAGMKQVLTVVVAYLNLPRNCSGFGRAHSSHTNPFFAWRGSTKHSRRQPFFCMRGGKYRISIKRTLMNSGFFREKNGIMKMLRICERLTGFIHEDVYFQAKTFGLI